MSQRIRDFIGEKAQYDDHGVLVWGINKNGGLQRLLDIRGFGAIQNLFKESGGKINVKKAEEFQDELGRWIATAINEKLDRDKR